MALVKFGGGITAMSGSIAGNTFARNRYGNYVRARTKPVNPNTTEQAKMRSSISFCTAYWHNTLTADQRTAWDNYASAVAMKNKLGESVFLSGFNHFVRSNAEAKRQALTLYADGPSTLALPEKDPTLAAALDSPTQKISVIFDDTLPWCDEDGSYMYVYMGRPQLLTRNYFGGPWKYAGKITGSSVAPPSSGDLLDAPFTLTNGQKVFLYARIVRADGRITEQMYCVTQVALSYGCTGTLTPDATCNYDVTGYYNNKIYCTRRIAGYFIWWDGVDSWIISEVLGTVGALSWKRTDPNIIGVYGPEGTATGDATISLGDHN